MVCCCFSDDYHLDNSVLHDRNMGVVWERRVSGRSSWLVVSAFLFLMVDERIDWM